ncbi:MAG: hypothetical protein GY946_06965, partial [bacterium]|nr:hypothetical protein [bacterium]
MDLILGLLWYAVFALSTTAHEAAHAWAALRGGDPTAYLGGQVTLNPIPHIRREPVGMLLLPLVLLISNGWCMGWASTPYDPVWERRYPRRAAWMAAAGPAANLVIAVLALVALRAGLSSGFFVAPDPLQLGLSTLVTAGDASIAMLGSFLSIALALNLILFVFNLLPVPPLDGATAINLFLSEDLALRLRVVLRTPALGLVLFGLVWFVFWPVIIPSLFRAIVAWVHPGMYD